jgi:hypothetical protein
MSDLKKLLDIIEENSSDDRIELQDSFDIELTNGFVIETGVVGFREDGIIVEADDIACKLLGINGIILENEEYDDEAGMSDNNLETLRRAVDGIDELIQPGENLPEWCQEKIAVAKSMLVAVWDYMKSEEERGAMAEGLRDPKDNPCWKGYHPVGTKKKNGRTVPNCVPGKADESIEMDEAEYQGRKVPLGKPMQGDVKKSKVYVRKPNGKVVKVNFGDKNMKIKKSNPDRRKSFRARHNCDNPGPRWKARYWSCRAW